ncbi:MAG: hypothetical protein WB543_14815 [Candidatus Acidiferrum sp.]
MNSFFRDFFEIAGIGLVMGTIGTLLACNWYRVTQREKLDWGDVLVFAKIFYGIGGAGLACYVLYMIFRN